MNRQAKVLFVASTGGHLAQLLRLSASMDASADSLWLTFRSPQSESLLRGRRVLYVPYVHSRDLAGVFRSARLVRALLRTENFDRAVSTGAALAVAALPLARLRGIPTDYIESVSRVNGPSLSGRIIAATRTARLHTQHEGWSGGRWSLHPSVFRSYHSGTRPPIAAPALFITLGTIGAYRFDSVIDAVLRTGLADDRTVWQLGHTPRTDLPGRSVNQLGAEEFAQIALRADVVISHAGVGTILELLDLGISPVIVPRRRARGEHVDDHQLQIAGLVDSLGLATVVEASELTATTLVEASGRTVIPVGEPTQ